MLGTPWSDGVPGLTQRQIPTGRTYSYKWKATQYGSYWYHAHERGQVDDGCYGAIVIHPAADRERPFGLISDDARTVAALRKAEANVMPVLLGDHRFITSQDAHEITAASGIELNCYDSILFNGKGRKHCWPADKIESLLDPQQRGILDAGNGSGFTPKGCMPKHVLPSILAPSHPTDPSAVPPDVFDVCSPTDAPNELIAVRLSRCRDETWIAFDLVVTFSMLSGTVSLDEHELWVYAVDGFYIEPVLVDALPVMNGNRFSFFVKVTTPGDYSLRFASTFAVQLISGVATVRVVDDDAGGAAETAAYADAPSVPHVNDAGDALSSDVVFFDDRTIRMFLPEPISRTADQTFRLGMRAAGRAFEWALNNTVYPMRLDNEHPVLFDPQPELHNNNITITTYFGQWIDIILEATSWPMPAHPIHKHGNHMYLLGEGQGLFAHASVADAAAAGVSFNLDNPPRRDTFTTAQAITGPNWMALRYHVDNAGPFLLHCHIQSHLLGGMAVVLQDAVDRWPEVPEEYLNFP